MTRNSLFLTALIVLSISVFGIAQDMKPEAGKLYNEGNAFLKSGNYNGAIEKYTAALQIEKDYRIFYQKGVALKKSDKLEESKLAFEDCLKLNSGYEGALNALGGVYFSMGNYSVAITNFEKILNSNASNSTKTKVKKNVSLAYAKLGMESLSGGDSNKGIEYLKKSVENDNYDAAYLSLAKVYTETGRYDDAIAAAQNALKYRSKITKGGPYYYLGIAYKLKGDTGKAKENFKLASADPTYKKTADYELSLLK
ncbi:MAG TPA: tetratricopeptide repeat protein [Ignavibacteriaceae bacterium]|nr:tetratricopeptide repeat protein [Ignavibacteriaceae bacterium]